MFVTSARWREAENLTCSQLSPFKITYIRTQSKKNRRVPVSKELYHEINELKRNKLFDDLYFSFMGLIAKQTFTFP